MNNSKNWFNSKVLPGILIAVFGTIFTVSVNFAVKDIFKDYKENAVQVMFSKALQLYGLSSVEVNKGKA